MQVLEDHMLEHFEIHQYQFFMHDGAPCHTAGVVRDFLEDHHVPLLDWPCNSPDLNPIENCWAIMKEKVSRGDISSVPSLMKQIREVWCKEMDVAYFQGLSDSMPVRLRAVIKAKGQMTKY